MSNWTEETWNFNSLDLSTYAHGVSQVVEGFPSRRGANRGRGYRHGTQWRRKFYDQRVISLSMFVQDRDANDTDPGTAQARRAQLNENIDRKRSPLHENSRPSPGSYEWTPDWKHEPLKRNA